MAISSVQSKGNFADNTTSVSLATDSNVTSGNLLVIYAMKYSSADTDVFVVGDLTKTAGTSTIGTIVMDVDHVRDAGTDGIMAAVYSVPVTGSGSLTLQLGGSSSGSYLLIAVEEFSGADVSGTRLAATNENNSIASTTVDSGSAASTGAAVFCGCCATYAYSGHTFTQDAAFAQVYEQESVDHMTGAAARRIVTGATTDSASWTISSGYEWVAVVAVYKEASGAGAQGITPAHLTNSSTIHSPTIVTGAVTITPAHLTNTSTIHSPTVTTGTTIAPDHLTNTSTVHNPTLTPGAVTIAPAHLTNTATIHAPDVLTAACINGLLTVNATNGRYLENSDGPLLLAGFHTWYNVQDGGGDNPPDAFDWAAFLAALVSYGCNFTKLWASMETAQLWADPLSSGFNPQYFNPPRYTRTGPGNAADGGLKFDLTQINADYLARVRTRAIEAGNAGIYCVVQLFQGWQIEDKGGSDQPFDYHPYNSANNINSVDGDFNNDGDGTETHTDTNNAAWSYQQDFIEALVDLLNDLDNIIWEVSNEDTGSTANTNWQEDVIDHLATYEAGKAKQHLIGRTVAYPNGSNTALNSSAAEWVSYNADAADGVVDGTKISAYDTDHTVGLSSDYSWIFQALCNGHGGAWYMDEWDGVVYGTDRRASAGYILIRDVLGYAKTYAAKMDLESAAPAAALSTTDYCLAKTTGVYQFLVYQDGTGAFDLTLTSYSGVYSLEWLRLSDGTVQAGSDVNGGAVRTLTPPWSGEVVAFLELTALEITPAHLTNTSTVHSPALTPGAVTIAPDHLSNTSALHSPTVTPGAVTAVPDHLTNTSTVHSVTVAPGAVVAAPDHLTNTSAVHNPTLTTGAVTITPDSIASASAVYEPTITPGAATITPGHLSNTSTVHEPTLTAEGSISPDHFSNTSTVHAVTVAAGAVTIAPDHFSNTSTVYEPVITSGQTVAPDHLTNTPTLHEPTVTPGAAMIAPDTIATGTAVYAVTITTGAVTVAPDHLTNTSVIHSPFLGTGTAQTIAPDYLLNTSQFWAVALLTIPARRVYWIATESRVYQVDAESRVYPIEGA